MTLKQILSQLEQLQLALDEHVELYDDEMLVASGCLEEARGVIHTRVLVVELEAIADRLDDEEDGREVYEDFRERAFTRGLG